MNLQIDEKYEEFRGEIRSFLHTHLPPDLAARNGKGFHCTHADRVAWTKILAKKGWTAPTWPVSERGPGWDMRQVMIFEEECLFAGAPDIDDAGFRLVGPVIYTFGTEEQKRRFLEPTRSGDIYWGQGFSEPSAGSDLASLSTSAVRDGDDYIVNGQKIWTTNGHASDYIFALVKTLPEAKQRGISFLIIETRAPGVTIRPIIDIGGGHSLNEIFFDNVRTPAHNLIGKENEGWSYTKFLLGNERAWIAEVPRNKAYLHRLKRIAADTRTSSGRLIDDPSFASRIAALDVDLRALEVLTWRALTQSSDSTHFPIGSVLKIRGSELMQAIGALQVEALGDYGAVQFPETGFSQFLPGAGDAPGVLADFFYRRATTVYGGSNEIQRSILAKSMLGF